MKPEGQFTTGLWEAIQDIYTDLLAHPFVNQLAKGSLAHGSFAHYLSQDILYISDDNVALENLSGRADLEAEKQFFSDMANEGLAIERELHDYFLEHFDVKEAEIKSPVIDAYTNFLLTHSLKSSCPVAAAALLPCFWVYNMVGNHVVSNAVENNVYKKWIDTYSGDDFGDYIKTFIHIVEGMAKDASEAEKKQMREAFITATKFELSFFEEAVNCK